MCVCLKFKSHGSLCELIDLDFIIKSVDLLKYIGEIRVQFLIFPDFGTYK